MEPRLFTFAVIKGTSHEMWLWTQPPQLFLAEGTAGMCVSASLCRVRAGGPWSAVLRAAEVHAGKACRCELWENLKISL